MTLREALIVWTSELGGGNGLYFVREDEGLGFEGPRVKAFNEAHNVIKAYLAADPTEES